MVGVGGWFFQEIIPLRGSILQAGTCQILSLAENPRWSRVWQYMFKPDWSLLIMRSAGKNTHSGKIDISGINMP